MPIHRRVVGLSGLAGLNTETLRRPQDAFVPGTWVIPTRGLYRGDVGFILGEEYEVGIDIRPNFECLVGFLPRLALPDLQHKRKRVKLAHPTPTPTPTLSISPVDSDVGVGVGSTLLSSWKAKVDYGSLNKAAGFPVPVERAPLTKRTFLTKRKRQDSHSRNLKIYQGHSSFTLFAKGHSIRIPELRCYECSSPQTCNHAAKRYKVKGQNITPQGFALAVYNLSDLHEAKSIPSKDLTQWLKIYPEVLDTPIPLPSSWSFDYGERVKLARLYGGAFHPVLQSEIAAGTEGWIQAVHPLGCEVSFIHKAEATGRDQVLTATENMVKFIPHRYLLKVMTPGDHVEIPQGSSPPLQGLVTGVDTRVSVKLDIQDTEMRTFHPNSIKNVSLLSKIHLAHSSWLPRNVNTTVAPQPQTETPNTFTGRSPWVGTEIKVIGTGQKDFPQMHKGEVGQVLEVSKDLSMKSGLAILIRFDAPSSSPDTLIDFDRIRRRDNSCFLAYTIDARTGFQFKEGYAPVHSTEEYYNYYGHPQKLMDEQNARFAKIREKQEEEEKAKIAERERLEIETHEKLVPNLYYVQGGAPLTLRAGTPPPKTDWFNDSDITKVLPRNNVMVALRDQEQETDVEVSISVDAQGINEGVYWIKPKQKAPRKVFITAQHLHPEICSWAAIKSYSSKLFLVCSGVHAGKLGRALCWGISKDLMLKHVRLEPMEVEAGKKKQRFRQVLCDGPFLQVPQTCCAHVPMMPDEEKESRGCLILKELARIAEKQVLSRPLTDQEKILAGV